MPFFLVKQDISTIEAEVAVSPESRFSEPDRGEAAGSGNLKARHVLRVESPVYMDGGHGEEALLCACYENALEKAAALSASSIAFPLIGSGACRFPFDSAFHAAKRTILHFLAAEGNEDLSVYLALPHPKRTSPLTIRRGLTDYRRGVSENKGLYGLFSDEGPDLPAFKLKEDASDAEYILSESAMPHLGNVSAKHKTMRSEKPVFIADESFSEALLRLITEKGMTDPECYHRANIDRKLFSKIRSTPHYQPKKSTVAAFAIALRLDPAEADELFMKAGFALSKSSVFDLIIRYCIDHRIYDIYEVNCLLFDYDQPLLGC